MGALISPIGRVSFPSIWRPTNAEMDTKKEPRMRYEITLLWPKTDSLKTIEDAIEAAIAAKWKKRPSSLHLPIKDGDEKTLDGYAGHNYARFSCSAEGQGPKVVDHEKQLLDETSERLYPGCFAVVSFTCYAYDNVSKGVSLSLNNVQVVKDGPRFDSRTDPCDDFGTWGEPAADDLLS